MWIRLWWGRDFIYLMIVTEVELPSEFQGINCLSPGGYCSLPFLSIVLAAKGHTHKEFESEFVKYDEMAFRGQKRF